MSARFTCIGFRVSLLLLSAGAGLASAVTDTFQLQIPSSYTSYTNKTSSHFAVFWDTSAFNSLKADTALTNLEMSYRHHVDTVGMRAPYANSSTKYKINIYIGNTGLQTGVDENNNPMIQAGPGFEADQWGIAHEFTHALQFGTGAFGDREYAGWFWESNANWMAHQEFPANAHCSELSVREAEWHYGSTRNMYCNWQFLQFLKEQDGGYPTIDSLWMSSTNPTPGSTLSNDEDPIRSIMRTKGWSFSQFGDVWGAFALRMARADFADGTVYRAAWWQNRPEEFLRLQQIALDPLDTANHRYVVPFEMAPQSYANNIVRLYPNNITDSVKVQFRGVVQAKNNVTNWSKTLLNDPDSVSLPGSNWHYGFAVVDTSSSTPTFRYIGPFSGATGSMSVLPKSTEQVFLVVSATPTNRQLFMWDQFYYTIYRYPWMVQVDGALPEGAQASAFATTGVAGKVWSNGGGFVANSATVASTVYVGPLARVLGSANVAGSAQILGRATVKDNAQVSGSAIIKDTAVVAGNAVVKDNATVSGHAYMNTGTVSGYGQVKGWATVTTNQNAQGLTVAGNAILGGVALPFGPAALSGTAQVLGDAELYGVTASTGVFYGLIDDGVVTDPTQGASLIAPMPEVTTPPPYTWPSSSSTASSSSVATSSSSSSKASSSSGTTAIASSTTPMQQMHFVLFNSYLNANMVSPQNGQLQVFRTDGRKVHEQMVKQNEVISLPLPNGIYLLRWIN